MGCVALITVVIPTYNRSTCIKYQLENYLDKYKGNLFVFEIHDSSTNDETFGLINNCNNDKISYYRYSTDINGDVKTIHAIQNVKTAYYFLLGDGVCVDFDKLEKKLSEICYDKYKVIGFRTTEGLNKSIFKDYDITHLDECDGNDYFVKYFWALTLYGSMIVRTDVVKEVSNEAQKYIDILSPFMHDCILFEGISKYGGKCAFVFVDFITDNPYKKGSGWKKSKQTLEFFCYRYYESVLLLPNCYEKESRRFLISNNKYSNLFGFKSLLVLRANGNVTFKLVRKYKFYIKKTIANPIKIYLSLLIPPFVLKGLIKIYRKLKRLN